MALDVLQSICTQELSSSGVPIVHDVMKTAVSHSVKSARRMITIKFTNNSSSMLRNPQVYTKHGLCHVTPQPTLNSGVTEEWAFGKKQGRLTGVRGVITYDITEDRKKKAHNRLAIMFFVPHHKIVQKNMFALGLFDINQACDKCLYDLMRKMEGTFTRGTATGSGLTYQCEKYTVSGTMSSATKAEMKVELWDED
ncbi:hypothetical protein GJAV_G00072100 [Gymnothorax javanicus]|nr:hypothetical protein GJAV_G00072100 [Gymnothorax javanicus]